MAPLVEALARTVVYLGQQRSALALTAEDVTGRLGGLLLDGREFADAEADRFRAECQAAEAETVRRLSTVLADTAERALTDRVRALDRRTAVLVGLAVAGALILGISGGWWAGDRSARAEITTIEDSVRAAFREGPGAAALWTDLMRWNDPKAALATCREAGEILIQGGRRACRIPFWIERPPPAQRM
ncbi:hypothetical protein [Methylobacterium nonmethylotrophicum]|uniref:Uncharacterized protein n=1 Tax=Methylobacterium nonmethylotrophicum TaxID=1141884 RepID=A0A4Z0NG45_9HYPH|nr:hypothetical protein [Methylobacterium nonmethylotrophicum]TGD94591.1 hypothetical protein EU555_32070 [Methylobacterium nonmethylotrophicum]